MDRLDELEVFVAIAEAGSLAAAARSLRRSPPAVTRILCALEERLGIRLIERTTRRLAVTEAGQRLIEKAKGLLADYAQATTSDAEPELRGLIRITAPIQFGRRHIRPIVGAFLDAHPRIQAELVLNDRHLDLIDDGLDVALRIGRLQNSGLVAQRVGEVRQIVIASPDYLARHGTPNVPNDLSSHETVFGTNTPGGLEWRFGKSERSVVRLKSRFLVNEVEAQLLAVRDGRGLARVLSYQAEDGLADGSLVRVLAEHEPIPVPVQLVYRSRSMIAPKVKAFIASASRALRRLDVINPTGASPSGKV